MRQQAHKKLTAAGKIRGRPPKQMEAIAVTVRVTKPARRPRQRDKLAAALAPVIKNAKKAAEADIAAGRPGGSLELVAAVEADVSATVAARASGRDLPLGGIPALSNRLHHRLLSIELNPQSNDHGRSATHDRRFLRKCRDALYKFATAASQQSRGRPALSGEQENRKIIQTQMSLRPGGHAKFIQERPLVCEWTAKRELARRRKTYGMRRQDIGRKL